MRTLRSAIALCAVAACVAAAPSTHAQVPTGVNRFVETNKAQFQADVDFYFPARRKNINWDAVPIVGSATRTLPADFFLASRQIILDPNFPADELLVSNVGFGDLNATYPANFPTFSPAINFKYRAEEGQPNVFRLADLQTPGAINAFGVVFTDVERDGVAGLEILGTDGSLIERIYVPAGSNGQNQFLGVIYDKAIIGQVNVLMGEHGEDFGPNLDVTNGGSDDVVVTDDFVFMTSNTAIPTINDAFLRATDHALVVKGIGFAPGSQILLNGAAMDSQSPPSQTTTRVVSRTAGSMIRPGQTVIVQVRNPDGTLGRPFAFTNS